MVGDYISREAAIAMLHDTEIKGYPEWNVSLERGAGNLESIPAADVVEVRHGFWWPGYEVQNCSICSYRGKRSYKFCPSCGAKMDGGQDDV